MMGLQKLGLVISKPNADIEAFNTVGGLTVQEPYGTEARHVVIGRGQAGNTSGAYP